MVEFLAKSFKLFKIYRKMKYLTFDFDLEIKVTKFCFLFSFIWILYVAIFIKIGPAIQDLSQNEIFDL